MLLPTYPFEAGIPTETERHSCPDEAYLEKLTSSNCTYGWRLVEREPKPAHDVGIMAIFQRAAPELDDKLLEILELGLRSGKVTSTEAGAVHFLQRCGLVAEELHLTSYGRLRFAEAITLEYQCDVLGLDLQTVAIPREREVEVDALNHFRLLGYEGSHSEGSVVLLLLKALCLGWLRGTRPRWDTKGRLPAEDLRQNASEHYFEAQLRDHHDKRESFVAEIRSCSREKLIENFQEIYSYKFVRERFPGLNEQLIDGAYSAIGVERLVRILDLLLENPYLYRKGWPDLAVFRGEEIRFVEVKSGDRLHMSQLITMPSAQLATGLPFSVLSVERTARKARKRTEDEPELPF